MYTHTIEVLHAETMEVLVPELASHPLTPKDKDLIHITCNGKHGVYHVTTTVPHFTVNDDSVSSKLRVYVLPMPGTEN